MGSHQRFQFTTIHDDFQSLTRLFEIVMSITKTFNNDKKFIVMNTIVLPESISSWLSS